MTKYYISISLLPSWVVFSIMILCLIVSGQVASGFTLFSFIYLGWLFSVGLSLQNKGNNELNTSTTLFKINILYGLIFSVLIEVVSVKELPLLIPFQVYGVYSVFYCLYFVSRSLVICEEQKILRVDRYLGTLFLFWFVPIGIWFLSPRIKRCIKT
jgi:hypothetical protein